MSISIIKEENNLYVYTPYDKTFVTKIKKIGDAKWTGEAWKVPMETLDYVRSIMMDCYGETDEVQGNKITLKVTFNEYEEKYCDSISVFGKTVARAYDRDSGAKVGDDVILLKGNIYSGGSRKNWTTEIDADTVFQLSNVSEELYNRYLEDNSIFGYDITVEKIENQSEVKYKISLMDERARLLARLEEIDRELAKMENNK